MITRLRHTRCVFELTHDAQSLLNNTMLQLTSQLTTSQKASLEQGTLQLKTKRLIGQITFKCASQLAQLSRHLHSHYKRF